MSPTTAEERRPGVRGQRVPGRPGRFDPSMPLHMTTRRRAQHPNTNGSPSVNGTLDDEDDGRRSSLDDARPSTSHSQFSQASANEMQIPEIAETAATPDFQIDSAQSSADSKATRSGTKPLSANQQSPSPSRKRKRSSPTPPTYQDALFVTPTPSQQLNDLVSDEEDAVEVVDPAMLSDRQVSESTSGSAERVDEANAVAIHSLDETPEVSAAVSPASSVSASGDTAKAKHMEDIADVVMDLDGVEVPEDAEEVDEADEVDEQVRTDEEGQPVKRNVAGKRRRGPHPNPTIEATMRRQLDLRRAYRTIARGLKAALAEVAQRTLNDVIGNPNSCEEAAEYEEVKAGLDAALEKRRAILQTQQSLDRILLEQRLHDETLIANATYRLQVADAQDAFMDQVEREMLSIGRAAQLHATTEQLDTDNEDDEVLPRPKRMAYRWKRGDALDHVYDSRSLPALETERALNDMSKRVAMRKMLQELNGDDEPVSLPGAFAVMDRTTRDAALARHQEAANTNTLIAAADEVERVASIPVVPNEQAFGLQLLGDLASRPSITLAAQEAVRAKLAYDSMAKPTPSRMAPPPTETHPIEFNASPRAQQIFRDRYVASMPPPHTPRQDNAAIAPSPDFERQDQQLLSPNGRIEQVNGLPPIAAKPAESALMERLQQSPFRAPESDRRFAPPPDRREDVRPPRLPSTTMPGRVQALAGVPDRRSRSVDERERYPYDTAYGSPKYKERPEPKRPGSQNDHLRRNLNHEEPLFHSHLHSRLDDRPTSPGAVDRRRENMNQPFAERSRPATDRPHSPHSRKPSVSIKQEARSEGSQVSDHPRPGDHEQAHTKRQGKGWTKTNKEERGGQPRRRRKNKEKRERQQSLGTPGSSGPSQAGAVPFAHTPVQHAPHTQPWQPPSSQHPAFPLPPPPQMAPHPPAPHYRGPPPQPYPFGQPQHDYDHGHQNHQHRNSYPPLQPPPEPNWGQPPPSALFALPSGQRPLPPPPGVPADQYRGHPFAPPPPPQYYPHTPTSTQPQSAPGSYGPQYGGPAIAPAMPDSRSYPPGYAPGPPRLPAFAQQQRNNEGQRRRTQSDAHRDRSQWTSYYSGSSGRP